MAKNQKIHTNKLKNSVVGDIVLGKAVEVRFLELCKLYLKCTGEQLGIPPEYDADFLRWRTMRVRHKKRDLRNTRDEIKSTRRIAQWTLDVKRDLCAQPREVIEWGEG